jgi:hypothetical protein
VKELKLSRIGLSDILSPGKCSDKDIVDVIAKEPIEDFYFSVKKLAETLKNVLSRVRYYESKTWE